MRVVVGEDEALLREGLVLLLERAGLQVVAAVGDAGSLLSAARDHAPDVVVSDIRMPPTNRDDGLRAGLALRRQVPGIGLVILSQHLSRRYALELLADGQDGVGYLWKQRIPHAEQFAAAAVDRAEQTHDGMATLTPRQREVLELVARGLSNSAIAATLFITEKSVVEHVSNLYAALEIPHTRDEHRRVLAVLRFLSGRPGGRSA